MAINILGIVSIAVFYLLILFVGLWAGWRQRKASRNSSSTEGVMLAGRNMGTFVGTLTMTATWVGGGYVLGSAEGAFTNGVVWCQAPIGYSLSLIAGGLFFAKPMRDAGYLTMLDPFQEKYGARIGGLLFIPALWGEILWSASILASLGSTISVILEMNNTIAVVVSAAIAMLYTLFGGLQSVAYTDVVQLFCIAIGLILCVPFAWKHPDVYTETLTDGAWSGKIELYNIGVYIENFLLLIIGGIPWQVYFQRVLACRSSKQAQTISYLAGFGALVLAAPPICLGVIARVTDWNAATNGSISVTTTEHGKLILPLVLQYLTPVWVSFIGLGAVSAAVMSSADSSILSSSTMFARNIYQAIFVPKASEQHVIRVMWVSIVIVTAIASAVALTVNSVYGLFVTSSDLVYVCLFPQLLLVLYWKEYCNSYGCIASFLVGLVLRILGGEPLMELPVILKFPFYDPELGQLFPFRTLCMIISLLTHVIVSLLARWIFRCIPKRYDCFKCFQDRIPPRRSFDHQRKHTNEINIHGFDERFKMQPIPRPQLRSNRFNNQKRSFGGQVNPVYTHE